MDVLKMAITLIKQSVTAGTEASQVGYNTPHTHRLDIGTWWRVHSGVNRTTLSTCFSVHCDFLLPQILIHSLQDCVRGIEEQAANTK